LIYICLCNRSQFCNYGGLIVPLFVGTSASSVATMDHHNITETIKIYQTVGTIPRSCIKIVEIDKIDTPNTQLHDRLLILVHALQSGGV